MEDYSDNEYVEENSPELSEDSEEKPSFASPPGKNVTTSVHEFLKQSTEIQEEIRKLSELCQQISPKKDTSIEEASKDKEEYEQGNIIWDQVNNLLNTHGFNAVSIFRDEYDQETPDIGSLSDTVVELITDYSNLARSYSELKDSYDKCESENKEILQHAERAKKLEGQIRELDRANKQLQEKLKTQAQAKGKEELLAKSRVKLAGRPASVFKAFMEQEFNPMKESDARIMALIQSYEDQKNKMLSELSTCKKEIEGLNNSFRKKEPSIDEDYGYSKHSRSRLSPAQPDAETIEKLKVLNIMLTQLNLKSYLEIPGALKKIQQVMQVVPGMDKFIWQVREELMVGPTTRLDELHVAIKDMKKQLQAAEKFKGLVCEQLGTTSEVEVAEKIRGLAYFCKLFEVKGKSDIIAAVENAFFFVHEIKMFLALARKILGLQSDCSVKVVLEEVMKVIQPESVGYYS